MIKQIKVTLIAILIALISIGQITDDRLKVEINENIELLGLAYFIGFEGVDMESQLIEINGKSIPKKDWHKYGYVIYEKYKKFASNESLTSSFAIVYHLWLDYIINLLVQLDNFPNAKLLPDIDKEYYINFSVNKDETEAKQNVTKFLNVLNKFYEEIDFKKYIDGTRPFYESSIKQVMENLPDEDFIGAMEEFYKKSFNHYTLIPSLTIPKGMGFGVKSKIQAKMITTGSPITRITSTNVATHTGRFNGKARLLITSIIM